MPKESSYITSNPRTVIGTNDYIRILYKDGSVWETAVIDYPNFIIEIATETKTLTNTRITPRVATATDDSTAVIDSDSYDEYYLTAIANNTTISITGTPTNGQEIFVGLKDAGVSKTITWTAITGLGVTLISATTASKQHIIKLKYIASAWRAIAVEVED